ncbi:MAG: molybdopterin molybdenumtransferase MoeA [Betaproteobacteria bacterium]|nr:molybdopterin molybdenumtransferase MoeA [Betaproteobacteria bacterium]NBT75833.1 molybdopterin molybdenumtransferase MoeA [Betaproteobacteria bacterium]NBY13849.1 molybdopterin molybdenumtransferase MoeA [Betaproteobacteria bacterium]
MVASDFLSQSVETALNQALAGMKPVSRVEDCALQLAANRVLARNQIAPHSVPDRPTSAMDGYALSLDHLEKNANSLENSRLRVLGKSLAGHAAPKCSPDDGCVRVFTGAPVPEGFDVVIPQEFATEDSEGLVRFRSDTPARKGSNIRARGEDISEGQVAVPRGRMLGPREMALLASLGIASVSVFRLPIVAVLSTGDELVNTGQPAGPTQIFDANRPMLIQMTRRLGFEVRDLGIVPDNPRELTERLRAAADEADVVLTSGGVSVGEADHTRRVMEALGEIAFWRLSIKPGRPLAFGHLRNSRGERTAFFGLPGNPVASFVTFSAIVRPCLERVAGLEMRPALLIRAQLTKPTKKQPGRTEYLRCSLRRQPSGLYEAEILASQGAASIKSLMDADGLAVLPEASGPMAAGDWVDVLPLEV